MTAVPVASVVRDAWDRQSVWSQVADNLKAGVTRARSIVLVLTISGALLSTAAAVAGLKEPAGKTLGAFGALAIGLAGIARSRTAPQAVQDWTRARSAAEGIKTEVYAYLTRVGAYVGNERESRLDKQVADIEHDVRDLVAHADEVTPVDRATPAVRDVESYARDRVEDQITGYYRRNGRDLRVKRDRVRRAEVGLAVVGVVLGVLAGTLEADDLAVWVPVVTTVATAITAHAAAERYDFLHVEYLRTADELERLVKRWRRDDLGGETFVRSCEDVISSQNARWMAKLSKEEEGSADG
jgi:SMODS and SLOG-associating 2TM effector domain 1/Protein of unknown function (DUF4231)